MEKYACGYIHVNSIVYTQYTVLQARRNCDGFLKRVCFLTNPMHLAQEFVSLCQELICVVCVYVATMKTWYSNSNDNLLVSSCVATQRSRCRHITNTHECMARSSIYRFSTVQGFRGGLKQWDGMVEWTGMVELNGMAIS